MVRHTKIPQITFQKHTHTHKTNYLLVQILCLIDPLPTPPLNPHPENVATDGILGLRTVPWSNLSFAADVGLVLLSVSNTCHSKKRFLGFHKHIWCVGWLVGRSCREEPNFLTFSKILWSFCFFVLFLEVLWRNHQLMLTFCEMIHPTLVSAQKHLSLMLEEHYLDPVDQHRDQFILSCRHTNWIVWMDPFVQPVCKFTKLIELVKSPRYDDLDQTRVHESIGKCTLTAYVNKGVCWPCHLH